MLNDLDVFHKQNGNPDLPILTPPAPPQPRINGPSVFGVRPGSPLLYTRSPPPASGPCEFGVDGPAGRACTSTPQTGRITGTLTQQGEYRVVLRAENACGAAEKKFRIVVGDGSA